MRGNEMRDNRVGHWLLIVLVALVALIALNDRGRGVALQQGSPLPTPTPFPEVDFGPAWEWGGGGSNLPTTSKYMTGEVLAMIIFPQCVGGECTEEWTAAQKSHVLTEMQEAMDRYEELSPAGTDLSFQIESQTVEVSVEPISTLDLDLWRTEAMAQQDPPFTSEVAYTEFLRAHYNTDWAFLMYPVDSDADADGCFANGWVGWAFVSGPSGACATDTGPLGTWWLNSCLMHEVGHIFGALDQRLGSAPCWDLGGWGRDIPNLNSLEGTCPGQVNLPSIMKSAAWPFVDVYMAGQVGWWPYGLQVYLPMVLRED